MTSFKFDYNTFYKYYMNESNLLRENTQYIMYYFRFNPRPKISYPDQTTTPNFYITIGGLKIYVEPFGRNQNIMFTIPNTINGVIFSDHYHFGLESMYEHTIRISTDKTKPVPTIFFHKTIQLPHPLSNGGKDTKKCWFRDGIHVQDIRDIICTQQKDAVMGNNFPFPFRTSILFFLKRNSIPFDIFSATPLDLLIIASKSASGAPTFIP